MANFRLISGAVDSYEGLSTDSKPSSARVGSKAKETDTGDEYTWDGSAWTLNVKYGNVINTEVESTSLDAGAGAVASATRLGKLVRWIADAVNNATYGLSAIKTLIDAIKARTDNLAGAAPVVGTVTANWNTATGTSGEAGEDLVTIGANDTKNKLLSLELDVSACTDGALLTVKMFKQINGVEQKCYSQNFLVGTDPDGIWVVQAAVGIHEALRVEVYSDTDESKAIAYDYMLEVM